MTVVLVGVGADGTNSDPVPPVDADGRFEYVPIPEHGREATVEARTYADWDLRYREGTAADYLSWIQPHGERERRKRGESLATWPLHHDPNFEALTYGESDGRPAYLRHLRALEAGDLLAFYTGLRSPERPYLDRYVIGYFTVDSVLDCGNLDPGRFDGLTRFRGLPPERQREVMDEHAANAHAKRFRATGRVSNGCVIVDGREPGGLLDRAFRISSHAGRGHHRLTDDLQAAFAPTTDGEKNAYLGGFKQAHTLDVDPDAFVERVTSR